MMEKTKREIVFFVLLFVLSFVSCKSVLHYEGKMNQNILCLIVSAIFVVVVLGVCYGSKKKSSSEPFWDVSLAAQCAGGSYMHQGDSELSKQCRALASTPEGRIQISGYNCAKGMVGQPGNPFKYTPLSDDRWMNERCLPNADYPKIDDGKAEESCSSEKQDVYVQ
jgi:hypothetical protein